MLIIHYEDCPNEVTKIFAANCKNMHWKLIKTTNKQPLVSLLNYHAAVNNLHAEFTFDRYSRDFPTWNEAKDTKTIKTCRRTNKIGRLRITTGIGGKLKTIIQQFN